MRGETAAAVPPPGQVAMEMVYATHVCICADGQPSSPRDASTHRRVRKRTQRGLVALLSWTPLRRAAMRLAQAGLRLARAGVHQSAEPATGDRRGFSAPRRASRRVP